MTEPHMTARLVGGFDLIIHADGSATIRNFTTGEGATLPAPTVAALINALGDGYRNHPLAQEAADDRRTHAH